MLRIIMARLRWVDKSEGVVLDRLIWLRKRSG